MSWPFTAPATEMTPDADARTISRSARAGARARRRCRRPSSSRRASSISRCGTLPRSWDSRATRCSAMATSLSICASCSRTPPRSSMVIAGSTAARTCPRTTCWPITGRPSSGGWTRPACAAWTMPPAVGSAITRPVMVLVRAACSERARRVRTDSSRCVGFGTNSVPSGSRRGLSDAAGRAAVPAPKPPSL